MRACRHSPRLSALGLAVRPKVISRVQSLPAIEPRRPKWSSSQEPIFHKPLAAAAATHPSAGGRRVRMADSCGAQPIAERGEPTHVRAPRDATAGPPPPSSADDGGSRELALGLTAVTQPAAAAQQHQVGHAAVRAASDAKQAARAAKEAALVLAYHERDAERGDSRHQGMLPPVRHKGLGGSTVGGRGAAKGSCPHGAAATAKGAAAAAGHPGAASAAGSGGVSPRRRRLAADNVDEITVSSAA